MNIDQDFCPLDGANCSMSALVQRSKTKVKQRGSIKEHFHALVNMNLEVVVMQVVMSQRACFSEMSYGIFLKFLISTLIYTSKHLKVDLVRPVLCCENICVCVVSIK